MANDAVQWKTINLHYFFWLPAGKDEFGFNEYDQAPLASTAFYRDLLEQTISVRFMEQAEALRESATNRLGNMTLSAPRIRDAELGLRKVHFTFEYQPIDQIVQGVVRPGPIGGAGTILSNGLYLWTFRIEYQREQESRLREVLERFLVEDFVERHVRTLLDFQWNADKAHGEIGEYHGILTYFQIDLLFNGVLDPAGHPHLALDDRIGTRDNSQGEIRARKVYTVQSLIRSLSLCCFGIGDVTGEDEDRGVEIPADCFPLFDKRKNYQVRGTYEQRHPYIDSNVDMLDHKIPGGVALDDREILLSRLAFAGMEQFLRVAISFGLAHYKAGLDHIRGELVDMGMRSYKNRSSGEVRRPSLISKVLTVADLQAHQTLLAGKVPVLTFLLQLINGLADVSRPLQNPQLNGRSGSAEWLFAKSTLDESRVQFQRQVGAIEADVKAIESSLIAVRSEMMLLELTEARKLNEIASETSLEPLEFAIPQVSLPDAVVNIAKFHVDGRQFERPIAIVALIFGLFEILGGALFFATQNSFATTSTLAWPERWGFQHWFVLGLWGFVALLLLAAAVLGTRMLARFLWQKPQPDTPQSDETNRPEKVAPQPRTKTEQHVFDYSSLQEDIPGGNSAVIMQNMRNTMMDIESPRENTRKCVNFSTFSETPSGGIERTKYSLQSPQSTNGLSYVLHVEVERRLSGDGERLQDIRLVIRRPADSADAVDIRAAATAIIRPCLQQLVFSGDHQHAGEVNNYLQNRMGLNPEARSAAKQTTRR